MEKTEYKVYKVPQQNLIETELNKMYVAGYEFVTLTHDRMIYKKIKKHKKD